MDDIHNKIQEIIDRLEIIEHKFNLIQFFFETVADDLASQGDRDDLITNLLEALDRLNNHFGN